MEAPPEMIWDEDNALRHGPVVSFITLSSRLLDLLGFQWHRQDFSSRTYRALRHCCYSAVMTHTILLTIFVHCFAWEGDPTCGTSLKVWAAATHGCILHQLFFRLIAVFCFFLSRRVRCDSLRSGPSLQCLILVHLTAFILTVSALLLSIYIVVNTGLIKFKVVVLFFIFCSTMLCLQCSKQYIVHLVQLERGARRAERRAFRERLSNNVLTIAEILEVRRASTSEEDVIAVLELQPVVQFDKEALGDHTECCICSAEFDADNELRQLSCGHVFHTTCLSGWFERSLTCPLCREDLAKSHDVDGMHSEGLAQIVGYAEGNYQHQSS